MNADWLLADDPTRRLLALACVLLPALLILLSRRSCWLSKLIWIGATQLPWLFVGVYLAVAQARYPETAPSPKDAAGWWMLAFPWAVYLLYRATRRRFAGEPRRKPGSAN